MPLCSSKSLMERWPVAARPSLPLTLLVLCGAAFLGGGCGGQSRTSLDISQQLEEALRLPSPDARAKRLVQVANLQYQTRDRSGARNTLVNALQAARVVENPAERASALNAVGFAFAQMDLTSKAQETWVVAEQAVAAIAEPSLQQVAALCSLSIAYGRYLDRAATAQERLEQARQLAPSLPEGPVRCDALLRIAYAAQRIEAPQRVDWWEQALNAARSLPEVRQQADALANAAEKRHRLEDPDGARQLFEEAQRVAESIQDPLSRGYALLHLAGNLASANEGSQARQQFDAANAAARSVADPGLQKTLLDEIRRARSN